MALSANREVDRYVDQELRTLPVGASEHIYKGAFVGTDPAGYLKAFVPGDLFAGIAYEEADNSSGSAGDINGRVFTLGDFELTLTSVAVKDMGKAVYATADNTLALSGHPDAFVGRVVNRTATNTAVIRLKVFGDKPDEADTGSYEMVNDFTNLFVSTGADGGTDGPKYANGFKHASVLGLGVHQIAGEDSGAQLDFDAVAEAASATIHTGDAFPVDKGITFEARLYLSDIGDDAALDVDWGLGTALTANSIASIDHADMVNLACFHMDGSSANINAQSDDDTTDVSPVDTTIDNATDAFKDFKIIVRPTGAVELWIEGSRVLSGTTFAVASTAALCGFVNLEKTSNDTTAVMKVDRIRVAGGRA